MNFTEEELRELEVEYVARLDAYKNGYNQTVGGVGMKGYVYKPEQLERKSISLTGEKNPQSKLTNKEFYQIVDLFKKGYTNDEIGNMYSLHSRYISLIRHKKRFVRLWEGIGYTPSKSTAGKENRNLSYEDYSIIRDLLSKKYTNSKIESIYGLSGGTVSRIRNGKIYADFYSKYNEELVAQLN